MGSIASQGASVVMNDSICTVDDLLAKRAREEDQTPLVAYPRSKTGLLDFRFLTARELDDFTNGAIVKLMSQGRRSLDSEESETIALLGSSDLDFMITMFALSRLGYTILILSPRLAIDAYAGLLKESTCSTVYYAPVFELTVQSIQQIHDVEIFNIPNSDSLNTSFPVQQEQKLPIKDEKKWKQKVAFIMHSSGSTGRPKSIFQTHEACLRNYSMGQRMRGLLTDPLYHTHGHACLYRAMYNRSTLFFLNANLPLTSSNLIMVMEEAKPEAVFTVPYALKLFAESDRGIRALQDCKLVSSAGSQIPDDLGDRLVANGVYLISHWGSTETGALMSSIRPDDDKDWAYMKIFSSAKPFVLMKPIGDGVHELVVLDGLKSKIVSNSNDPPHSFHTNDTFISHPTKQDRWKYCGRLDDRITLINGEKVLPTIFEGRLRENPLVREAVIFGIGRALPGLLLFRSQLAGNMNDTEYINCLFPEIHSLNSRVEAFAHITKDTIVPLSVETDYPRTDKGTIIRPQVYRVFAKIIDEVYDKLDGNLEGTMRLDQTETEQFILNAFHDECSIKLASVDTDFFTAGADSLHAIRMSSFLKGSLYLGDSKNDLRPNTIFEQATARRLAAYLVGRQESLEDVTSSMTSIIKKYSTFNKFLPISSQPKKCSALLTGGTGSLGIYILSTLLLDQHLDKIYCLVRASSVENSRDRIIAAFTRRGMAIPAGFEKRAVCLPSNLAEVSLGLEPDILQQMRKDVSLIIHVAWAVNFNLGLRSFEDHHIRGTHHLINFALSVEGPQPASFVFCSSIAVASHIPPSITIPEALIEDLTSADMGYGQSKLVTEHIVHNAGLCTGMRSFVVRIGQIVGDGDTGFWNETESIPLIIRSALSAGCLPAFNESCWWLPVDFVARAILELERNTKNTGCHFYHLSNPHGFSWKDDLLPELHQSGLAFDTVSPRQWVSRLKDSEQDPEINPTIKLMSTYESRYNRDDVMPHETHTKVNRFEVRMTQVVSESMRNIPDVLQGGYVKKFLLKWLESWQ